MPEKSPPPSPPPQEERNQLRPCGACGKNAGSSHKCSCGAFMHGFCGVGVGDEGFGRTRLCPTCVSKEQSGHGSLEGISKRADFSTPSKASDASSSLETQILATINEHAARERNARLNITTSYWSFGCVDQVNKEHEVLNINRTMPITNRGGFEQMGSLKSWREAKDHEHET